jgi:16S rRNA (guanine966-N2)-methyltransferase
MLNNQLRIIAGLWRGRKLSFPSVNGLRPTSDRMRETLFNWLGPNIVDSVCLDAFAGSGALGFEALSRQAGRVVFLERSDKVAKQLRENAKLLKTDAAEVHCLNSLNFLKNCSEQFDLIFLDPPFASDLLSQALQIIEEKNLLKESGLLYLEQDKSKAIELNERWQVKKEKTMGQVLCRLLSV